MMIGLFAIGCRIQEADPAAAVSRGFDHLFPQGRVPVIRLDFEDGFQAVEAAFLEQGLETYRPATFEFEGETLQVIGARIKGSVDGGVGRPEVKYALKLNFNYFDGERFHRVDKIHLENNKPDPAIIRERMSSRMYRAMGVPASRTSFVRLEVNGEDFGLYTQLQDVDKLFLKDTFGTADHADDGNLYKCAPPGCSLLWNGTEKGDYLLDCDREEGCGLVLETNLEDPQQNDYADLINLLDVLNNTPEGDLTQALLEVFEVDAFLRWLAVAVAISDHDSYLGSIDNFYLYRRPDTGRFVFIPWDHNKSYGLESCELTGKGTGCRVLSPWCDELERPLLTRVLAVPQFREQYLLYLNAVVDNLLTEEVQQGWIDEFDEQINDLVAADPHGIRSLAEYQAATSSIPSGSWRMNLMEFVKKRRAYLVKELDK